MRSIGYPWLRVFLLLREGPTISVHLLVHPHTGNYEADHLLVSSLYFLSRRKFFIICLSTFFEERVYGCFNT